MTQAGRQADRQAGRRPSLPFTIYVVEEVWAACHELIRLRFVWLEIPLDVTPTAAWSSLELTSLTIAAVLLLLCLGLLLRVKLLLN